MNRIVVGHLAVVIAGLLATGVGLLGVREAEAASQHVNIIDTAMTLTPTAADYNNDYVQVTGASGCRVEIWTNNSTGAVLFVKCVDAAPRVALPDFLVKTQTPPGVGGTSMTTFTAIAATDQALWSTTVGESKWGQVNMDIRIKNLFAYPDAIGAGTTAYTNNVTFTLVAQ